MKQRRTGIIVLFVVLTVLIVLYFAYGSGEKRYQWYENYRSSSDQPYGTLFIQKMLESYRPNVEFTLNQRTSLEKLLSDVDDPSRTDYVFIGHSIFLDSDSKSALKEFLDSGGDAFVSSIVPPQDILDFVYYGECGDSLALNNDRVVRVTLNFFHEQLKSPGGFEYAFRLGSEDQAYTWNYFDESIFCGATSIVPLGFLGDQHVNFLRIPAGKGNLYLHSNPLAFTNYFLAQPEKVSYATGVFSHLDGQDIIWDEYSKLPFVGNSDFYNSPLYYIMQQPSLKYAWWLLLITIVLYIIFAGKRKQRVIPVTEPKTNTSLEFVNLISRLHYKNGNHLDMAHKKMRYFLYFVRSRYGIHAEKFKEEQIRRLADKSRVRFSEVDEIFSQYYLIEDRFRNNIEANRLVDLNDAINNFYEQCK
jgi:hypothetical protein